MDTIVRILLNLILSIPQLFHGRWWDRFIASFYPLLMAAVLLAFLAGAYVAFKRWRIGTFFRKRKAVLGTLVAAFVAFIVVTLIRRPLNPYLFFAFLAMLLFAGYLAGVRLGFFLLQPGNIIVSLIFFTAIVLAYVLFMGINYSAGFSRETVREAYRQVYGKYPGEMEKRLPPPPPAVTAPDSTMADTTAPPPPPKPVKRKAAKAKKAVPPPPAPAETAPAP